MAEETSGRSETVEVDIIEVTPGSETGTFNSIAWSLASAEIRSERSSSTSFDSNLTGLGILFFFGDLFSASRKLCSGENNLLLDLVLVLLPPEWK